MLKLSGNISVKVKIVAKWPKSAIQPGWVYPKNNMFSSFSSIRFWCCFFIFVQRLCLCWQETSSCPWSTLLVSDARFRLDELLDPYILTKRRQKHIFFLPEKVQRTPPIIYLYICFFVHYQPPFVPTTVQDLDSTTIFRTNFMGEEEQKKAESNAVSLPTPPVKEEKEASLNDAANEKNLVPVSEKVADPTAAEQVSGGSNNRDAILSRVETEKRYALIKAWVENEKAKVENKAHKKLSAIGSWETTKKVSVEAKIKKFEEKMERKKAEYAEKMKNKVAELHKAAEEKKAMIEAKKSEECLKVEETAAKFRATGYTPKKFLGCFSS
ncbi:hypothetical protein SADUNF_Sadunf03G0092300 [Salix dunnii]|uniref:Remorin C-terminal domain-containing protein n=1 Tax=Salix dunnii TaxID=1413687 RepID=A0A835N3E6_9ROSI|nr:hypothetical protein SADUNF_Sadunf03G0092300 [Salix dunnii]